ncbi:MAG TPA: SGNH/GDSL hydrolase family protein [Asticcacaulis sp.]|nr:SGNH/GDSL hydrolase family protein [Asticcacaulis sp.]
MRNWACIAGLSLAMMVAVPASAAQAPVWAGSWASGQQIPEPANSLSADSLTDATLRELIHLSIGGGPIRVRVSNVFGTAPLTLTSVHAAIALAPGTAKIGVDSDHALTFSGRESVTIPAGADVVSDPADFLMPAGGNLAISLYFTAAPAQQTSHPGARTTSFLVHGNHVADPDLTAPQTFEHWFNLSGVDVAVPQPVSAVVIMGDSITDGRGSTPNGNNRWPDMLATRLSALPAGQRHGVLNVGIGGNRVLLDSLGPSASARFIRDVLAQTDARYLLVLEGINDIGTLDPAAAADAHTALVEHVEQAYAQMIARAREHGVMAIGATILPFAGSDYYNKDPRREADRQAINAWIRTPGNFDAVVDFDVVTRDPAKPDALKAEYDSGDHLHPSAAGYAAMGAAVPLDLFADKTVKAVRKKRRS